MAEGWTVLTLRGVQLQINPSWFLALTLFTIRFQPFYAQQLPSVWPAEASWLTSFAAVLLIFASVLLHELGHVVTAIREGAKVHSLTFFFFGCIARVDNEGDTAMGSFRIAAAGPLVSLMLALGLLTIAGPSTEISPVLPLLCTHLGVLNLIWCMFNLLPGLPLDGGLILKALVWKFSGSHQRGVEVATASGRALATLMIVLGGFLLFQGGVVPGLMLMLFGWLGLWVNRNQTQMLQLQTVLRELKVEAAAGKRFRVLEADQTLRRLSQLRLTASEAEGPADWVLVCKSGRWVGWIDDQPLKLLPVQQWDQQRLEDHLRPLTELPSIASSAPLVEAVPSLEAASQGRLLVMSAAGLPSGTLDRMDVGDAVLKRLGVTLPPAILNEARKRNGYPLGLAMLPQMVQTMQAQSAEPDASSTSNS